MDMLNLKIIIGSTRPGRAADQVTSWIVPVAGAHDGFAVEVADLREWDLPIFGETGGVPRCGRPGRPGRYPRQSCA
jgi:NAD(P)H-dependent FMN reductase